MQLAPARVGRHGDEPARLQRGRGLPRIGEALADDHGRRRPARASASPTRMVITATLLDSVPGKSRGAPGASAAATEAHAGKV